MFYMQGEREHEFLVSHSPADTFNEVLAAAGIKLPPQPRVTAGVSFGLAIDLDGDTDRNGVIDRTTAEEGLEGTNSVIVINNCDRDGFPTAPRPGTPKPDNADDVINGPEDRKDLEPIIIRKFSGAPTGEVSLRLRAQSSDDIDEKQRVRIFKSDGIMIIGPSTSTKYVLTNDDINALKMGDMTLLVEGLNFATSVKVSVFVDSTEKDSLILEVAPFILTPHSQKAVKNYVVKTISKLPLASTKYVDKFNSACTAAGAQSVVLSSDDVWIEDEMSWGYSETPRVRMPVAMHLYRLGDLRVTVRRLLGTDVCLSTIFDYGPDPGPWPTRARLNQLRRQPRKLPRPRPSIRSAASTTQQHQEHRHQPRQV